MLNDTAIRIEAINWLKVSNELHVNGYATVPKLLTDAICQSLIQHYHNTKLFRKTVNMAQYRFGHGEYKYFNYPLPALIQTLREEVYLRLVPVANAWMEILKKDIQFPPTLEGLHSDCRANNQLKPTTLLLKYEEGGFNTLHQDLYGDIYFPLQAAIFLNQPGIDYTGGEFVLTQQRPRAQSKAIVLTPNMGDMIIFATNFQPAKGSKGYHQVKMRHGVSEVQSGRRHALGIIFHDAES